MARKNIIIRLACLLALYASERAGLVFAGPANPRTVTVTQRDGTRIRIRVHGDEFNGYVTTEEGYSLAADKDGDWAFATLGKDGLLKPTQIKAKPENRLTDSERRILDSSLARNLIPTGRTELQQRLMSASLSYSFRTRSYGRLDNLVPPLIDGSTWRAEGNKRLLVILAEYPDVPFTEGGKAAFNELLNSENYTKGGATGSVRKYFQDNSNGQFCPDFTVAGPYVLSEKQKWYKDRPEEMAAEVISLADKDVDYSLFAENGTVRDIFIFYSGGAESNGDPNGIWPHRTWINKISLDGVTISGYACSSELESGVAGNNTLASIGTFCHEFGHIIGLPDLYDTAQSNSTVGTPASFSLMAIGSYNNGGRTPPSLSILERWMLGWSEPESLESSGEYTLPAITEGKGYLIKTRRNDDYYLLECRGAGKNVWDTKEYLDFWKQGADWGLLVYHVIKDNNSWIWNRVNVSQGNERYKIFYSNPKGRQGFEPKDIPGHCFFPGEGNVTSIYSGSDSDFVSADGKETIVEIPSIRLDKADGSVSLSVTERNASIKDIKPKVFQHDILLCWTDEDSSEWTVDWKAEDDKTAAVSTRKVYTTSAHIPMLEAGKDYSVTITNESGGRITISLRTEKSGGALPRIGLFQTTMKSGNMLLMMLVDCGEIRDIEWKVDGTNSKAYTKPSAGEHYIQAKLTRQDGTVEYFGRFIDITE